VLETYRVVYLVYSIIGGEFRFNRRFDGRVEPSEEHAWLRLHLYTLESMGWGEFLGIHGDLFVSHNKVFDTVAVFVSSVCRDDGDILISDGLEAIYAVGGRKLLCTT